MPLMQHDMAVHQLCIELNRACVHVQKDDRAHATHGKHLGSMLLLCVLLRAAYKSSTARSGALSLYANALRGVGQPPGPINCSQTMCPWGYAFSHGSFGNVSGTADCKVATSSGYFLGQMQKHHLKLQTFGEHCR